MDIPAYLHRRLAKRDAKPADRPAAGYVERLDELRRVLATDLAAHRIGRSHA